MFLRAKISLPIEFFIHFCSILLKMAFLFCSPLSFWHRYFEKSKFIFCDRYRWHV